MKKVVIIGVGQERGLGAQLAFRFASMGMHVFIASRTKSRLEALVKKIENNGGKATPICADATKEDQVQ